MGNEIWILTEDGLWSWNGEPLPGRPFASRSVTCGAAGSDTVALIVDEREVWTKSRGTWRKEADSEVELYSLARTREGRLLVGTADARLSWLEEGTLRPIASFDAVPERRLWDTPYGAPPELRSLALGVDGTIYANVHVGWIVRSMDAGATWRSLRKGLDRDVHQVAAHPRDPMTVFAATAEGFHISHDQGDSFDRRPSGMPYLYQRATVCFPDRDVYFVSTARHNGGAGARLYRSEDEGKTWVRVRGLPETLDRNINTHQVAAMPGGHAVV
ncbi:MAG: WD40/YVTN/BNR-like repeat-containing protein, partial [Thermoplasmata archaeon]